MVNELPEQIDPLLAEITGNVYAVIVLEMELMQLLLSVPETE